MNLFSSVLSLFGMGGGLANPDQGKQQTGPGTITTDAGINVADERALGVSAVWACTQIITDSVASLPLDWHRTRGDQRELLEIDHPVARLFWGRPNKYMKTRDFRRSMTMQLALWNNAYAKIDWIAGRPVAITPLSPARMQVERGEGGLTYHYQVSGGVQVFAEKSILHMKGMSAEGVVGVNRVDYARQTLGLAVSAQKYGAKQFANGGRPGGVLTVDAFLKPEQRAQLAEIYEGISQTAEGANKLWVLEGGTDYKSITDSPDKLQMLGSQEFNITELCRFFGIPPALIGAGSSNSGWPAAFEQQVLSFLTFTLQSYLDEWESALPDALIPIEDRREITLDHREDDFIRMDSTAKANFLSRLAQNGLITRNEGRKKLRMPRSEEDGMDSFTAQTNLEPMENLADVSQAQ